MKVKNRILIIFMFCLSLLTMMSFTSAKQLPPGQNYDYSIDLFNDTYYITYNLDDGIFNDRVNTYISQDNDIYIGVPTKSGYVFTGWTGTNGNIPNTNVIIKHGSVGNYKLTANWKKSDYNITWDLNGGEGDSGPLYYNVETDKIVIGQPYRAGYEFTGWTGSNGEEPSLSVEINTNDKSAKHYKANWKEITYKIFYRSDEDGSASNSNVNKYTDFNINSNDISIANPIRKGYNFTGWTGSNGTNKEFNLKVNKGTIGDRFYQANWSIITYTLSYNYDGGNVSPDNPENYNVETPNFTLVNPTKEGYTFDGYSGTGITGMSKSVTIPRGSIDNRSYKANWTANKYKINFNNNGGSGNLDSVTYTYGQTYNLPDVNGKMSKNGYEFMGWDTKPNGDGKRYQNKAEITNLLSDPNAEITLYAQWRKTITHNFYANGSQSIGSNSQTCYLYNNQLTCQITLPSIEAKSGFSVVGWKKGSSGTSADKQPRDVIETNTNENWYAITKKVVNLNFNSNGNSSISKDSASCTRWNGEGNCSVQFPTITMNGWNIIGWSNSSGDHSSACGNGSTCSVVNDATYYAQTSLINTYTFAKGHALSISSTSVSCTRYNGAGSCGITTPSVSLIGKPTLYDIEPGKIVGFNRDANALHSELNANSYYDINSNIGTYIAIIEPAKNAWTIGGTENGWLRVRDWPEKGNELTRAPNGTIFYAERYINAYDIVGDGFTPDCANRVWFYGHTSTGVTGYACTYYMY